MSADKQDFDIIVIGGGSAGYAAANAAQRYGVRVAIVDPGPLGGLCILRGCMPTKAILRSSDVLSLMRRAAEFGLLPVQVTASLSSIIERKDRLIADFARYRMEQLKDPRYTLFEEPASFVSPHAIRIGNRTLTAQSFVIATGSVTADFAIPGLRDIGYITSDTALELREAPASMIVLGGGPVAVELAQFYQRIGTQVTLIQRSHHILSKGDEDLARPVEAVFREEGMIVYTGTELQKFTRDGEQRTAHFIHEGREKTVSAAVVLQAMGRVPNIVALNLSAAGVQAKNGRLSVNSEMRTNQPHIFAAGDVSGLYEVVHIAIQQGEIAAYNAAHPDQPPRHMDYRLKTAIVFTDPQVAEVGVSEKECKARNIPYLSASYPFNDHGKSIILGEAHGHVKLLCTPDTGEILGGHIVGPAAAEMIHQIIALMHFHGTVRDMLNMPYYHPTLSEILSYPAEELANQLK